jgi:undecaprenyl-phosphate 4-deoxy-4-formamido-L-arabinose transferase
MTDAPKSVCVIIPVYQSVDQLEKTVYELRDTLISSLEMKTLNYELQRVVLVDDGSSDGSAEIVKSLSQSPLISAIYLNRNYGQHAAIFAAVLSSTEDVIVTMDEDGEHNPKIIENMIEKLELENYDIVYARFKHKKLDFRETLSKQSKKFISFIAKDENINLITSYRAVRGSVFRSAAVYANNGSFLDIALSWISNRVSTVEAEKRDSHRASTYTLSKLVNHFNKLFFAAGIRPLIFLFNIGWITSLGSLFAIGVIIYRKIFSDIEVQGWVSSITVILFIGGIMISAIGLVARYLSAIVETSSGKPFFTIKNK